jgi:hypothetical protein
MKISNNRWEYSNKLGREVELKFKDLVQERGNIVYDASREENIYNHIDYWVNGKSVDVKGFRHYACIWLELKNVHGNNGWLESDVDYIAFDIIEMSAFFIFKRCDLLQFVLNNVKESTENKLDYMKFYTRSKWDRKDVIIKVSFNDINHLLIQKLSYATNRNQ